MKTGKSYSYRFVILASAVLLQACFGATYSWAVFVEPLKQLFGKGQGAVQLPFSVFYIFFDGAGKEDGVLGYDADLPAQ